jgi:cob(I)alamin adenosyltransferase
MGISSKKGDSGYTSLLRGERVPKYHPVTEAVGTLDEANAQLGLARASSKEKRIKRILLQVQKHLFIIGGELSVPKGRRPPKRTISEVEISWLEKLIDDLEEALDLPPGFVAFGQEKTSSQMDVARTSVRKAERLAVKSKSENLIENPNVLKYLNRLSDLIFVLACFQEKSAEERRKIGRILFSSRFSDPAVRKWAIILGSIILILIVTIVLLLSFHRPSPELTPIQLKEHMREMEDMHGSAQD